MPKMGGVRVLHKLSNWLMPLCNGAEAGLEPATYKSQVQRPTDSATTPPEGLHMQKLSRRAYLFGYL